MSGRVEVVQEGHGFTVSCPDHGRIVPAPGKVWASHIAAGFAAMAHAVFVFHGKGAR